MTQHEALTAAVEAGVITREEWVYMRCTADAYTRNVSRKPHLVAARERYCAWLRAQGLSWHQIKPMCGWRSHASAIAAERRYRERSSNGDTR